MTETEIVHEYLLANQESGDVGLMVTGTISTFFVLKKGRPCGDGPMFSTGSVRELRSFIRNYKEMRP